MRKLITLVLLLLLTACGNDSIDSEKVEEENNKGKVEASADVVTAEAEELPWEKYDTQEIYDLVNEGKEVFSLDHADALEEEFFRLYESGDLTEDWGKYLHVYGAKLQPENPEYKEYFDLMLRASTNIENGMFEEANGNIEHAREIRGAN